MFDFPTISDDMKYYIEAENCVFATTSENFENTLETILLYDYYFPDSSQSMIPYILRAINYAKTRRRRHFDALTDLETELSKKIKKDLKLKPFEEKPIEPMDRILIFDDICALQEQASEPDFHFSSEMLNKSAKYGSIQCFKFIYLNLNNLPDCAIKNSMKGGNIEIIKICNEKQQIDKECAFAAIKYHRNNVLEWIINENCVQIRNICYPLYHFNLECALYVIITEKCYVDHTYEIIPQNYRPSPLYLASEYNIIPMIQILVNNGAQVNFKITDKRNMSIFSIDGDEWKSPISIASDNNNDVIKATLIANGAKTDLPTFVKLVINILWLLGKNTEVIKLIIELIQCFA